MGARKGRLMLQILASSTIYVCVPVKPLSQLGVTADPTGDVVTVGFAPSAIAEPDSYADAIWEVGIDDNGDTVFFAACLIGPDAVALEPGIWWPVVHVEDNPEFPNLVAKAPIEIV